MLTIFGNSTLDERRKVSTTHDAFVVVEMQLRNAAQFHFTGQLHAQETCRRVKHLNGLRNFFGAVLAHHGHENLRMTDITTNVDGGDSHQADARIFDLTANQLSQLALHLIANTLGTAIFFGHVYYLSPTWGETLTV